MIVLPDEDLKQLEKHFGPEVRHMGAWNSDGVFGFCAVPLALVEEAAEAVGHPGIAKAVEQLKSCPDDRTQAFVQMVHAYGHSLVRQVAATHRRRAHTALKTRTATQAE